MSEGQGRRAVVNNNKVVNHTMGTFFASCQNRAV